MIITYTCIYTYMYMYTWKKAELKRSTKVRNIPHLTKEREFFLVSSTNTSKRVNTHKSMWNNNTNRIQYPPSTIGGTQPYSKGDSE